MNNPKNSKKLNVVLVRSPQPYLVTDVGELYSPNRLLAPEPTLPLLSGILQDTGAKSGLEIKVTQLDLRDSKNGEIAHEHYGDLRLPYIESTLRKMCSGIPLQSRIGALEEADVIGFTNNFTMSRNIVRGNIQKVRAIFPDKEIWIGGRDVFSDEVVDLYAESAGHKNLVIFDGHAFYSLPEYVQFRAGLDANPHSITSFDKEGKRIQFPNASFMELARQRGFSPPTPIYSDVETLDKFNYSGEGPIAEGHGKFAHITLSVGCPHKCGYCTTGWRERGLVVRSIDSIKVELDYYKSMGVKTLAVMDDNLLSMGVTRVNELMAIINSYGFNTEYGNGLELRLLHKYWEEVHESVLGNCNVLYAPLEDLTEDVSYRKLEPIEEQLKLIELAVDYFDRNAEQRPRYITLGVILGVPGHTREGLYKILPQNVENFLELFVGKRVNTAVTAFNYMPLIGTSFGDQAIRSGRMAVDIIREHPEVVNFELTTYAPDGLTHAEVFEAYRRTINLNPAGRLDSKGNNLGVEYVDLKRLGERALPENERDKLPQFWRDLGKEFTNGRVAGAGMHYKAPMTEEIVTENRRILSME